MDPYDLEALAVETYERNGFDPAEPVSTLRLARKIYGPGVIVRNANLAGMRPAAVGWVNGKPRIALQRTVPTDEIRFHTGHELAHLIRGVPHDDGAALERECDYLGAALSGPRPAIVAMRKAVGWDIRRIAKEAACTQTWAALRLAEADRIPLVTVGPHAVRVRGPDEYVWPDEQTLRRWVDRPGPGVRKVRISDRTRRAVLVVDD